jgi:hypothetical protein
MLEGFASDAALNNTEHVINAAQMAGIPIPYQSSGDFNFQRDLAGSIQNGVHGYRSDGQGPVIDPSGQPNQMWQAEQAKPSGARYIPHLLNRNQAEFTNTALNILPRAPQVGGTQFQQTAQQMAQAHGAYTGQLEGENSWRARLDAKLPTVGMRNRAGQVTRNVP